MHEENLTVKRKKEVAELVETTVKNLSNYIPNEQNDFVELLINEIRNKRKEKLNSLMAELENAKQVVESL